MAVVAQYLIDTSAAARMRLVPVAGRLAPLIESGLVATCAALDFEALHSARSPREYAEVDADRKEAYEYLPTDDSDWQWALAVHAALATRGQLRVVGLPDLLIAAVAVRHQVSVLHYDSDFDTIASVSALESAWVVRAGSVD